VEVRGRGGARASRARGWRAIACCTPTDYPPHGDVVFCKLFMKIVFAVNEFDANFVCKQNCVGTIGFSLIKKCTAYLKMLAYGAHADTHFV
jgi:hypothetical protein